MAFETERTQFPAEQASLVSPDTLRGLDTSEVIRIFRFANLHFVELVLTGNDVSSPSARSAQHQSDQIGKELSRRFK